MPIYDISHPLQRGIAVWDGDTPYSYRFLCHINAGASVNLGSVEMSVHTGSHADAPFHYGDNGATMEAMPIETYIGAVTVIDVTGHALITRELLEPLEFAPRVLFKTGGWNDVTQFPERITTLEAGVAAFLAERGVVLVGFDVPSVDALDSKTLPIHHELGVANIAILESLALTDVPPGNYELIALPLKLVGADGSPVRAILRTIF